MATKQTVQMLKAADISPCGTYRYKLTRVWDPLRNLVHWVCLNPSVADAEYDDASLRRMIGFARRWDYGGVAVYNLFALRSTSPKALYTHPDPVGPDNDITLLLDHAARVQRLVVAGWGTHGRFRNRDMTVLTLLAGKGQAVHCLGRTKDGFPRHPLRLAASTPLEPYRERP